MFSTTTIPLSTSIPNARTSEKRTITLNVIPNAFRIIKLMNMESGIATPTNNALRNPRKNKSTPTTSRPQVPFFPWARSHQRHHFYHQHETADYSHPWMTERVLKSKHEAGESPRFA